MSAQDLDQTRGVFYQAWQKQNKNLPIEPLESQIIDIINLHPEYHFILEDQEKYLTADFSDTNPFLHLSLHLAIREQIKTNRPAGIHAIFVMLCKRIQDAHEVEHQMMECLAKILWTAQRAGKMPEESFYLENLKKI